MQLPIRTRSGGLRVRAFCVGGEREEEKGKREISTMAFGADVPFPSALDGWMDQPNVQSRRIRRNTMCGNASSFSYVPRSPPTTDMVEADEMPMRFARFLNSHFYLLLMDELMFTPICFD